MSITKNSISRKIVILSMAFLLLGLSLFNPFNRSAHAEAVLKLASGAVGERALVGILEQGGITHQTKSAIDVARKRWNMGLYEKIEAHKGTAKEGEYIALRDYINSLDSTKIEPIPNKPGFGRILIDSSMYLSAFALGYDLTTGIIEAGSTQTYTNRMEDLQAELISGDRVLSYGGISTWVEYTQDQYRDVTAYLGNPSMPESLKVWGSSSWYDPTYSVIGTVATTATDIIMNWEITATNPGAWEGFVYDTQTVEFPISTATNDFKEVEFIPTPEIQPLSNPMPWADSPPDIASMPETIAVTIPTSETYSDPLGEPWNEPLSDPTTGGPGDGGTTPPEEEVPSGNPFKDLVPVAFMLALLDLLRAILMYLARMFEFILTIPLIPIKEIDNQAFQWFKSAQIIGVHIYTVVSTLASIGLSFAVYKSIRRILP